MSHNPHLWVIFFSFRFFLQTKIKYNNNIIIKIKTTYNKIK